MARAGDDEVDVVIFRTLSAVRRPSRWARRPKRAEPGQASPAEVPVSRVTVIGATGFEDEADATAWLERCRRNEAERHDLIQESLLVVNRAVHGHRVAGSDPYVRDVDANQAQSVRVGYGTGDDVVEGHWKDAYDLPAGSRTRSSRRQMLAPQEELAGILSGKKAAYVSDDLVLRARLDLDQGRSEQAALQLRSGVDALIAEMSRDVPESGMGGLDAQAAAAGSLATAALQGKLSDERVDELRETIAQVERVQRRRRYGRTR